MRLRTDICMEPTDIILVHTQSASAHTWISNKVILACYDENIGPDNTSIHIAFSVEHLDALECAVKQLRSLRETLDTRYGA